LTSVLFIVNIRKQVKIIFEKKYFQCRNETEKLRGKAWNFMPFFYFFQYLPQISRKFNTNFTN